MARTGEYMLTPFWVSIFLGPFPLLKLCRPMLPSRFQDGDDFLQSVRESQKDQTDLGNRPRLGSESDAPPHMLIATSIPNTPAAACRPGDKSLVADE